MTGLRELQIAVLPGTQVSAVLQRPDDARCVMVLGHGAGAGMRHAFMEDLANALATAGVATLRYQFPYMEQGRRIPDPSHMLRQTVRAAVNIAGLVGDGLPLFAGGKSLGGRMTSHAAAERTLHGVMGVIFFGFPLHPIGVPGTTRADHLARVPVPMLFLQGTRDRLADLDRLRPVLARLGPRATLVTVPDADHEFGVPRRSGRTRLDVLADLAQTVAAWAAGMGGTR